MLYVNLPNDQIICRRSSNKYNFAIDFFLVNRFSNSHGQFEHYFGQHFISDEYYVCIFVKAINISTERHVFEQT